MRPNLKHSPLPVSRMGDESKSGSRSTPSWQQGEDNDEKEEPREKVLLETESTSTSKASRSEIKDQALKFLDEEEVKNAPAERKIEFLERKGLSKDEIQELVEATRNTDELETDSSGWRSQGERVRHQTKRGKLLLG